MLSSKLKDIYQSYKDDVQDAEIGLRLADEDLINAIQWKDTRVAYLEKCKKELEDFKITNKITN